MIPAALLLAMVAVQNIQPCDATTEPKTIAVKLTANWHTPPLLFEAAEAVRAMSTNVYWKLLDFVAESDLNTSTDREQYQLTLAAMEALGSDSVGESMIKAINYSVSLSFFAPKYEMLHQVSRSHMDEVSNYYSASSTLLSCSEPVIYLGNDSWSCGIDEFNERFAKAEMKLKERNAKEDASSPSSQSDSATSSNIPSSTVFEFDASCGGNINKSVPVMLYSELTSSSFRPAHRRLRELAREGRIHYTLRSAHPNSPGRPMMQSLQGYGVELAIKSQEYKVLDDLIPDPDAESGSEAKDGDESSSQQEIEGFYFDTLKKRRADLVESLDAFRLEMLKQAGEANAKVKVWDIQDLGVQTTGRILRSQDPLAALVKVVQDFPMYAPGMSKMSVNQTIKQHIVQLQSLFKASNYLEINSVGITEASPFELHSTLLKQSIAIDGLVGLGLKPSTVRTLISPSTEDDGKDNIHDPMSEIAGRFRVDLEVKHESIVWLNDMESGVYPYNQWASSVREFLTPAWPNQMRYIAKNLHRLVVFVDPTSAEGLDVMQQARFFVQQNAPITVGMALDLRDSRSGKTVGQPPCELEHWSEALKDVSWGKNVRKRCDDASAEYLNTVGKKTGKAHIKEVFAVLFHTLVQHEDYGPTAAWEFASNVAEKVKKSSKKQLTLRKLRQPFLGTALKMGLKSTAEELFDSVTKLGAAADTVSDTTRAWIESVKRWGVTKGLPDHSDGVGHVIVLNGAVLPSVPANQFRRIAMTAVLSSQMKYQHAVYRGQLNDETDIDEWVRTAPNTYPRLNDRILQDGEKVKLVESLDLPGGDDDDDLSLRYLPAPTQESEGNTVALTHWVIADMSTAEGMALVSGALQYWESPAGDDELLSRIAFIHNPAVSTPSASNPLLRQVVGALVDSPMELGFLNRLLLAVKAEDILEDTFASILKEKKTSSSVSQCGGFCADALGIPAGANAVVTNGRVAIYDKRGDGDVAFTSTEEIAADMRLLDAFIAQHLRLKHIVNVLSSVPSQQHSSSLSAADLCMHVAHRLATAPKGDGHLSKFLSSRSTGTDGFDATVIRNPNPESLMTVNAVIDPVSEDAQKMAPILLLLRDDFGADITVYLSPSLEISDVPLKRFYRTAYGGSTGSVDDPRQGKLMFDEETGTRLRSSPGVFQSIRSNALLTMGFDAPDGWLISSARAPHDLDNLMLSDLAQRVNVEYEIDHALIEGQCIDMIEREPPAGLQLELGNASKPHVQDTLVMHNLGYFQLKANPGLWRLRIAPNRHGKIFKIQSAIKQGTEASSEEFSLMPVHSFMSKPKMVSVTRRKGMERAELLDYDGNDGNDDSSGSGILGSISSLFSKDEKEGNSETANTGNAVAKKDDRVHVFSLASGMLYERFLKIMMQSVVSSTKSRVKFWFLSNFLSPEFKSLVPKMAAHLGFDVEFVTYLWPKWLREQTVKQRIIWGYKILFLDVLFPLNLKRIIYIDADQVVRGDVKELWDMDLKGAPYGYTPFCNTNTATNGFRFWDSGYWKNHLGGKKYHISALYVVDLVRFRRMRAGDTLRSIYDNLSADPNSLANLDQDLPNYAQHTVPIYSLPQEWLWCETWCSMETLNTAKTIDLCNNPLTKKPKLDVARELLPEWTVFDERQRNLTASLATDNGTSTEQSS
mmetsp:Transcript_32457/g.79034  ORF Transcript_32457/g.79034 Transcript_32457/m.79034 type:complete len:1653 (-) Transcript_32457:377-5335(-)|eukprot:CAMPEP_0114491688 /NCGR_PEP_ID=MMETSP0109-20121206/3144_1 /TAXON_ID=29199 /ORGANISM="Chlorarachnion reptans, Strain CCCM449" /LENGTH=1652 /DNA_ID=CAMNT_0001668459 /DNA_START=325 /DNA_END=5283 /DNA_ORIENTATION=-